MRGNVRSLNNFNQQQPMNAYEALKQLDLSAYELAEAERYERRAKAIRMEAIKRMSSVSAYFSEGIKKAQEIKAKSTCNKSTKN